MKIKLVAVCNGLSIATHAVDAQPMSPLSSSLSLSLLLSEAEAGSCTDRIWRRREADSLPGWGPGRLWCQVGLKWSGVEAGAGHRVARALCRLPMLLAITGKSGALPQGAAGQGPSASASLSGPHPQPQSGTLGSWSCGPHPSSVQGLDHTLPCLPVLQDYTARPPWAKPQT